MIKKKKITGIIIAGGKSSRMGKDKGFLLLKHKLFLEYIIEALQPLVHEIMIVSNNSDYDVFNLRRVEDLIDDAGPVAGIYTGLYYSNTNNNLVLSCDIPLINTNILEKLTQHISEDIDIIQLESDGKTMPLIALYKKQCTNKFLELLQQGERRLRVVLNQFEVKTIPVEKALEKFTININTPEQLNKINHEY